MPSESWVGVAVIAFVVVAYIVGTVIEARAASAVRKMDEDDNADARFDAMMKELKGWIK